VDTELDSSAPVANQLATDWDIVSLEAQTV